MVEYLPEKSVQILTHYTNIPTGLHIAWDDSLPWKILSRLITIAADQDLLTDDTIYIDDFYGI